MATGHIMTEVIHETTVTNTSQFKYYNETTHQMLMALLLFGSYIGTRVYISQDEQTSKLRGP
jgi:hypothetical protein